MYINQFIKHYFLSSTILVFEICPWTKHKEGNLSSENLILAGETDIKYTNKQFISDPRLMGKKTAQSGGRDCPGVGPHCTDALWMREH